MTSQPERHGRLPWLLPDDLDEGQRIVYDHLAAAVRDGRQPPYRLLDSRGRLEGPFNAMLTNPGLGDRVERLGAALRFRAALPDRCREIAILVVAAHERSDFEWYAHELIGRACGLSQEEMAALRTGAAVQSFSANEAMVQRAAVALSTVGDLDDELFGEAERLLGAPLLDELVTLVGYYRMLALSLRVWRTPLPDGVASPFAD